MAVEDENDSKALLLATPVYASKNLDINDLEFDQECGYRELSGKRLTFVFVYNVTFLRSQNCLIRSNCTDMIISYSRSIKIWRGGRSRKMAGPLCSCKQRHFRELFICRFRLVFHSYSTDLLHGMIAFWTNWFVLYCDCWKEDMESVRGRQLTSVHISLLILLLKYSLFQHSVINSSAHIIFTASLLFEGNASLFRSFLTISSITFLFHHSPYVFLYSLDVSIHNCCGHN